MEAKEEAQAAGAARAAGAGGAGGAGTEASEIFHSSAKSAGKRVPSAVAALSFLMSEYMPTSSGTISGYIKTNMMVTVGIKLPGPVSSSNIR